MSAVSRVFRELMHDNSANAVVVSAFSILAMIGGAGLATDTIQWTLWKRQLQRMSDSAALAGAFAAARGNSANSAAQTELNRYNIITLTGTTTIETPPTVGPYNGNGKAVRVVVNSARALPFSSMFMSVTPNIQAQATAAAVGFGTYCVISLEDTSATGITIQGSSHVSLGCGMSTNSQGTNALSAGGSAQLTASPLAAVGDIPASSVFQTGTVLLPYALPQPDPFTGLTVPAMGSCNQSLSVAPSNGNGNSSTRVQNNGNGVVCYKNIDLKGPVTFDPGVYIVDGANGGALSINSGATVNGAGVTFILTTSSTDMSTIANVTINGNATMNLSAPQSSTCSGAACSFPGILMYQDRRAGLGGSSKINGSSSSVLAGAFYFPGQELQFSGDTGMNTDCLQLVARRVTFTGSSTISNTCSTPDFLQPITGLQIRLVN